MNTNNNIPNLATVVRPAKTKTKVLFIGPVVDVACSGKKTFYATGKQVLILGSTEPPFCTFGENVRGMWVLPYHDDAGPAVVSHIGERSFYEKAVNGSYTGSYYKLQGDPLAERESKACFTSRGDLLTRLDSLTPQRRIFLEYSNSADLLFAPGEGVMLVYSDMEKNGLPLPICRALKQLRPGVVAECYLDHITVRSPFIPGEKKIYPELIEEKEFITGAALSDSNELFISTNSRLLSVDLSDYLKSIV